MYLKFNYQYTTYNQICRKTLNYPDIILIEIYFFHLSLCFQMALDSKTIKEEIPDSEMYDTNLRRTKGKWLIAY